MAIKSYQVSVPDASLERLKQKLSLNDLPDEVEGAEWEMGTPLSDIKRLVSYWKDEFDWRKSENDINNMPQFKTSLTVDVSTR